ncbi:TRAP transporter small permease [Massilia sp. W12]|uniref:TRAP transporter small permease n=1 Tax=Massilia sp. W12 TaxID=3126507 RepID=UPI0030D4A275
MKYLDRLEEILIASLMACATLIIFVAVLHRYASGWPIPWLQDKLIAINMSWAREACILMFVWMAKFGAAYGVRSGIHVGVDVLVKRLGPGGQKFCILFSVLAGVLFTATLAAIGAGMVYHKFGDTMTTEVMELPLWMVYLAIPLASGLMAFRFLQVGWTYLKTGAMPQHDHGHVDGLDEQELMREQRT